MTFRKLPDNRGQVFVPGTKKKPGKNPCPDCFNCQWCSDDRCLTCRPDCCGKKKEEQPK